MNFGNFCAQAARSPPLPLPPQKEAGAGHCWACAMVTLDSWTHGTPQGQPTNCSNTSSCSFNPGSGAVENHRKGEKKNPSQNPTRIVTTNWGLFKKTPSLQSSEYRQLSCFKKLAAARCWLPNTCFFPRFQISSWQHLGLMGGVFSSHLRDCHNQLRKFHWAV